VSIRPIFILSAPRSGSTLLQRVLAAHSEIATASEPWLLLPPLQPLYDRLPGPGARDSLIHEALQDLLRELPGGRDDYRAAVRELATGLYARLSDGRARYFVDKTPLYHLIADEIFATFPDARFLFLFRNPLSVVASCIELFDAGRWEAPRYHMALFQSFADLAPAADRYRDRSLSVRFEDLVLDEETSWRAIVEYLDLEWEPQMLERFNAVPLHGRMGDPIGTARYTAVSPEPLNKWRASLSNPLRRSWCSAYLRWLGPDRLETMGYDIDQLQLELTGTGRGTRHLLDDARRLAFSMAREIAKAQVPRYTSRASTWRALLGGQPSPAGGSALD
jgi:hypothetical protein